MIQRLLNNKDVDAFRKLVDKSTNIVLTCHVRPDGDALGSTLGLYHLLKNLGKEPVVLSPDTPPKSLSFMPGFSDIVCFTKYPDYAARLLSEADLLICCDFNKLSRVDELSRLLAAFDKPKVLIDHHLDPDDFADVKFSYPEMSSASELVFRLIAASGLYEDVNLDSATAICTGIITDTRNLSVNCHYLDLYSIVEELLRKGVDKEKIVKEALETKSLSSVKLQAYALYEKLVVYDKHKAAVVSLDAQELEKFSYEKGDTEGLVNEALQIKGVVYAIFIREDKNCIKVSCRSIGRFPVNKICEEHFNGGGHLQAAGGQFTGSISECIALIEFIMPQYDKFLPSKTEIN